jgi:hypothetical protein
MIIGVALFGVACSDGEVDAPTTGRGLFSGPSAFDRQGCVPGSLAGFDPSGIWHQDNVVVDVAAFTSVTRYDVGASTLHARVSGRDAQVSLTRDDLFTRTEYDTRDGDHVVLAFDACAIDADGALTGKFGYCNGAACITGVFTSVRVERIAGEQQAQGIELVSEWGGDPAQPWDEGVTVNVRVLDGIAYLARYHDGLRIVDVADPSAPRDLGGAEPNAADDGEIYNDVKIVTAAERTYALMASNRRGVVTYDVTEPGSPLEVATFPPIAAGKDGVNVHTLFTETTADGTRAFVTDVSLGGIRVYDVTDPASPQQLGAWVHAESAKNDNAFVHDLYVDQGMAYLCGWDLGLQVVDASNPASIELEGAFREYERRTSHSVWVTEVAERRIAVAGDEDWGAHVRIVDVDPDSPDRFAQIGALMLRPEVSVHNIMAFGDRAYVAWYQDGLRVLDLADPTQPKVAAYFNSWDGRRGHSFYEGAVGLDVDLAAGLVYVADSERGLLVLRPQ